MTRIRPIGCTIAVAKSPDNTEVPEDEEPVVRDLGAFLAIELSGSKNRAALSSESGRIVKGVVTCTGDCEHHHFEEGDVVWYVADAAVQLRDTYVVPVVYIIAKEEEE